MAKIVPAILENTKTGFVDRLGSATKLPGIERIQVDFGDGIFVPNKMLSVSEMDVLNPAFHFEAHLMTQAPNDFFDYELCGFKTILIHHEAYKNKEDLMSAVKNIIDIGLKPGICINNSTPLQVLQDFYPLVQQFQLMAIEPGFQGQPFIDNTFERVKELRKLLPNAIIEVDGGVNIKNIKQLAVSGADLICVGSALVKQPNVQQAYEELLKELK